MKKIFEAILEQQCLEWKDTQQHTELSNRLTQELENQKAYTGEIECIISNLKAQCLDDGIKIGFVTCLRFFDELERFEAQYKKDVQE